MKRKIKRKEGNVKKGRIEKKEMESKRAKCVLNRGEKYSLEENTTRGRKEFFFGGGVMVFLNKIKTPFPLTAPSPPEIALSFILRNIHLKGTEA
jgi:hypothetical protein